MHYSVKLTIMMALLLYFSTAQVSDGYVIFTPQQGGGGGGFGGPREMHPAVCAQCGIDTEVPFLPRGDRPVYCSDCFSAMRR